MLLLGHAMQQRVKIIPTPFIGNRTFLVKIVPPGLENKTFLDQNCAPWIGNRTFLGQTDASCIGKIIPSTAFWIERLYRVAHAILMKNIYKNVHNKYLINN